MRIKLARVVQTCWGCPSQWDAWDAEGNQYYLRYRWGGGRVDRVSEAGRFETVATFSHGDAMDGVLDLETFARLAGLDVGTAVAS